jgi:hypothetical protein
MANEDKPEASTQDQAPQTLTEQQRYARALIALGRPLANTEVGFANAAGTQLEILDLKTADAAALAQARGKLPAAFQEQQRQIADLLANFQSTTPMQLPEGMTWEQVCNAASSYTKKLMESGGKAIGGLDLRNSPLSGSNGRTACHLIGSSSA